MPKSLKPSRARVVKVNLEDVRDKQCIEEYRARKKGKPRPNKPKREEVEIHIAPNSGVIAILWQGRRCHFELSEGKAHAYLTGDFGSVIVRAK